MDTDEHGRAFSGLSNLNRARGCFRPAVPPLFRFPVQMSNRLGESKEAPYDQLVFQTGRLAFSPCHIFHRMHRRAALTLSGQLHRHMKQNNFVIIAAFFATVVICSPFPTEAAGKKPSSPDASSSTDADASPAAAAAPGGKIRATPFKGIIAAVDDKAKTFTIAGKETSHSLKITDKTIITRGGQPATMKDVVSNEEVRGSYYKMPDGSIEAKIVKLGPLTEAEKEARRVKREEKRASISPTASATPSEVRAPNFGRLFVIPPGPERFRGEEPHCSQITRISCDHPNDRR